MSPTNSAVPDSLYRYSNVATQIDSELGQESGGLAAAIQYFEDKCTEPCCRVSVGGLAQGLADYARESGDVDTWVRYVGRAFEIADWLWTGWGRVPILPVTWLSVGSLFAPAALLSRLRVPEWLNRALDTVPWLSSLFRPEREAVTLAPSPPSRSGGFGELLRQPDTPSRVWRREEIVQKIKNEMEDGRLPRPAGRGEACPTWAKDRRRTLRGTLLPDIGPYNLGNVGADQYLRIFQGRTVKLSREQVGTDLTQIEALRPGTAVIWERKLFKEGTEGASAGHVAVVEAVQSDKIWVSHSNWDTETEIVMEISRDKLPTLHLIPPDTEALTREEVAALGQ